MYRAYKQHVQANIASNQTELDNQKEKTSATMAASSPLKVIMFLGSVRENRLCSRVATFMKKQLESSNYQVEVFDPMVMDFPLLSKPLHFYRDQSEAPQWLRDAGQKIKDADAYVVVSAEYNHAIPPALSNMMDHFACSTYSFKPSGIVCYSPGIYGGMRVAMQLRAFLGELGCISVSNIFGIPEVHKALDENGVPTNDRMEKNAQKLIDQLSWNGHAMKNHRNKFGVL